MGADASIKTYNGNTAADIARKYKHDDIAAIIDKALAKKTP